MGFCSYSCPRQDKMLGVLPSSTQNRNRLISEYRRKEKALMLGVLPSSTQNQNRLISGYRRKEKGESKGSLFLHQICKFNLWHCFRFLLRKR